jgi:hypothetical protein
MLGSIADHIQANGGKRMEFIVSVIASAAGSFGVEAVKSGYAKLKELIRSKYGKKSALAEAVQQLEQNPDSVGRKAVLAEEVEKSGAHKDAELRQAAEALQQSLAAYQMQQVDARGAKIGVLGDNAHVEGGIHFGGKE